MGKVNRIQRFISVNGPLLTRMTLLRLFPHGYAFLKAKPYLATLNITDKCCLRCVMCNQWQHPHPDELKKEEWFRVLDQLKGISIKEINFTGGEPLMRTDIFEIIAYAHNLGFKCGLTSNGYLMDDKIIEKLIEAGITVFNISMDATGEVFDQIRGVKGGYERVYQSCFLLSKYRKKHKFQIFLCFLLMKKTLPYYKDVFQVGQDLFLPVVINLFDVNPYFFQTKTDKADFWIGEAEQELFKEFLQYLVEQKSRRNEFTYHSFSEIAYFAQYFTDPLQKKIPCVVSQSRICLGPKGQVYGGCWAMGTQGNAKDQRLAEIMRSPAYVATQKKMFFKKCPGCSCGYALNLRYSLPYIMREMRYRLFPSTRKAIFDRS